MRSAERAGLIFLSLATMDFELKNVVWQGPEISDPEILGDLPEELQWLLGSINGFIQFAGGLHVRGACVTPQWHSLRECWRGEQALHHTYQQLKPEDIPFAQDYLGNQFLLRGDEVLRLSGETGALATPLKGIFAVQAGTVTQTPAVSLDIFLMFPQRYPQSLGLELLDRFREDGGSLEAGQLLHAYPPLCSKEARQGVGIAMKAVPVEERLAFLAKTARKVQSLREGEEISFPLTR
jgi:hypothetical protein